MITQDMLAYYGSIAQRYGWARIEHKNDKQYVYKKGTNKIYIKFITATLIKVETIINHPKLGRNRLERKLFWTDTEKIFHDPRIHTGYGKRKKLNKENSKIL